MPESKKIQWDKVGEHFYETGVDHGILYPMNVNGQTYDKGVAWNGLTAVTESPEGAEVSAIYADNIKYLNLMSAEDFKATIEAYTYPEEFEQCDGSAALVKGLNVGQQTRKTFAFCYTTSLGNDTQGQDYGYKIHIIYGCKAKPSEKSYSTINDSPEAVTFSWDVSTVPVPVEGKNPTATVVIDSTRLEKGKLKLIEDKLYGTESAEPTLPLPNEIKALMQ